MGKTLLKMHVYHYNGTRWEGDDEGRENSKHIHLQGMWSKSLDLKITSPEKLAIMEFTENFLCLQKEPEKPQSKRLKL